MATRKPPTPVESRKLSAEEIKRVVVKINKRIDELESFDVNSVTGRSDPPVESLRHKINTTLADCFGEQTPEHRRYYVTDLNATPLIMGEMPSRHDYVQGAAKGFERAISNLRGLVEVLNERLEDHADTEDSSLAASPKVRPVGRKVFVVHGHDDAARLEVERFLRQLNFEPVVLHDQANAGRTLIEKLERFTDVDFAIILLTPDDEGRAVAGDAQLRPRARQNVVLELGLFYGLLGRGKVCALHKGNLELPSDFQGVLYTPLDAHGGWHLALARELRAAGLVVDMNLVV